MPSAARFALFARRLFLKPGLAAARAEFGFYLVERNAAGMQQDQQMIKYVGGLADQALPVVADRGNRRLDRLLAELFSALIDAAIEQLAGIGYLGALAGARLHASFQIADGKARHRQIFQRQVFQGRLSSPSVRVPYHLPW